MPAGTDSLAFLKSPLHLARDKPLPVTTLLTGRLRQFASSAGDDHAAERDREFLLQAFNKELRSEQSTEWLVQNGEVTLSYEKSHVRKGLQHS